MHVSKGKEKAERSQPSQSYLVPFLIHMPVLHGVGHIGGLNDVFNLQTEMAVHVRGTVLGFRAQRLFIRTYDNGGTKVILRVVLVSVAAAKAETAVFISGIVLYTNFSA